MDATGCRDLPVKWLTQGMRSVFCLTPLPRKRLQNLGSFQLPSWYWSFGSSLESSLACVSSSGIAIKKVIALVLALAVIAPAAHSAQSSIVAAPKKAKITPSPSPAWPPKGFIKSKDGNTFAKIPTSKELVGLASNDKVLTRALARKIDDVPVCEKFFLWRGTSCLINWMHLVGSDRNCSWGCFSGG
jgi:hypothetical protein